jgi:hypothetical protein
MAIWDHGPLGFGRIAAHGHADANMFILYHGSDPIFADPGSYEYHGDVAARDRFRSTAWHSTVSFGGANQSENLGPFLWGGKAEVRAAADGFEVHWFSGERHWRKVQFEQDVAIIEDRVAGPEPAIVFPLGPGVEATIEGDRISLRPRDRQAAVVLDASGVESWRLEPMEFSPRFSWRTASQRLVGRIQGHSAVVTIRLVEG